MAALGGDHHISIHAPAWGATLYRADIVRRHDDDFNSRPRVGGDVIPCTTMIVQLISIHAPAWGATG